jgi:signal transduction histidine kinase
MKKNKDNPKNIGLLVSNPWNTTALTPYFLGFGIVIVLVMAYFDISDGGLLLSGTLLGAALINPITKRIHPIFEAYIDIGIICVFMYHAYFFYLDIDFLLLMALLGLSIIRIVMHSFTFRKANKFWSICLHLLPISTAIMAIFGIGPNYSIPIPTQGELQIIGATTIAAFAALFIQTISGFTKTLNFIENSKIEVANSYQQVLELHQILNHNLRTPLATALGQLEILLRTIDANENVAKAKLALDQAILQTSSVNNAKKAFSESKTIPKFLESWKIIYAYDLVKFEFDRNTNSYEFTEGVAIALAVSLGIFSQNAVEAGATEILIRVDTQSKKLKIHILDDGSGATKEVLENLGKPVTSSKKHGTGLGTYLAQRILGSVGAKVEFSNRKNQAGFNVTIVF